MKKLSLATKILIGLILGVIVGLFTPLDFATTFIKPFGDLFLRLIKMIIVPLVLASLVVGAASVGDVKKLGRIGGKTMAYYLLTSAFAVVVGLVMANILQPGAGLDIPVDATYEGREAPPIAAVLLDIIPENPVGAMVNASMLQIIAFALFLGIAITLVGERANPVKDFFDGLAEVMYKITGIVMAYAPIGVFGLIVPVVAKHGLDVLAPLAMVILAVYLGCFLHAAVVYSSAVKFLGKMNPLTYYKGIAPAALVAFTTCSSSGTLPVTIKCVEDNLGVSKEVSSFCLPLGATVNMDGTAVYMGVCALFVAQVYGLDLSFSQQLTIVLVGTLASIGAAGVPGAGLIMLTMTLTAVNLPLEGVALVAGIDRILDMARTCVNVTGDTSCCVVVAASENDISISPESKVTA